MVPILTVLFVVTISLVVVRVATVGLVLTGTSKDLAQFQALSAFTGAGFTTTESENIVNHPIRRRIAMHLMLLGHAGAVIAMSSILLTFLKTDETGVILNRWWFRMGLLIGGIAVLWIIASSRHVERLMYRINLWALKRWAHLDVSDYTKLLRLSQNFVVSELKVKHGDWLADRTLLDAQLSREGVLVLGIEKSDGTYVGAPRGQTHIHVGDSLILYGMQEALVDLDSRRSDVVGNLHHVMAVTRELERLDEQIVLEEELPESESRQSAGP